MMRGREGEMFGRRGEWEIRERIEQGKREGRGVEWACR